MLLLFLTRSVFTFNYRTYHLYVYADFVFVKFISRNVKVSASRDTL
jgi:hypothetical protein